MGFDRTSGTYRERMKRIARKAEVLNDACDEMTADIEVVEGDLASAKVGVEVEMEHPFYSNTIDNPNRPNTPLDREWKLGYAKVEGTWHIVVNKYEISLDEGGNRFVVPKGPQPLAKASRLLRMEAHPQINGLLELIDATLSMKADYQN
ncbi:hypothetical protein K2Z84_32040 [Candidatus Binatia bacterium]|nr:hypothetical protein [Candidatus Binatia bacterium]